MQGALFVFVPSSARGWVTKLTMPSKLNRNYFLLVTDNGSEMEKSPQSPRLLKSGNKEWFEAL